MSFRKLISIEELIEFNACETDKYAHFFKNRGRSISEVLDEQSIFIEERLWVVCKTKSVNQTLLRNFAITCADDALQIVGDPNKEINIFLDKLKKFNARELDFENIVSYKKEAKHSWQGLKRKPDKESQCLYAARKTVCCAAKRYPSDAAFGAGLYFHHLLQYCGHKKTESDLIIVGKLRSLDK